MNYYSLAMPKASCKKINSLHSVVSVGSGYENDIHVNSKYMPNKLFTVIQNGSMLEITTYSEQVSVYLNSKNEDGGTDDESKHKSLPDSLCVNLNLPIKKVTIEAGSTGTFSIDTVSEIRFSYFSFEINKPIAFVGRGDQAFAKRLSILSFAAIIASIFNLLITYSNDQKYGLLLSVLILSIGLIGIFSKKEISKTNIYLSYILIAYSASTLIHSSFHFFNLSVIATIFIPIMATIPSILISAALMKIMLNRGFQQMLLYSSSICFVFLSIYFVDYSKENIKNAFMIEIFDRQEHFLNIEKEFNLFKEKVDKKRASIEDKSN